MQPGPFPPSPALPSHGQHSPAHPLPPAKLRDVVAAAAAAAAAAPPFAAPGAVVRTHTAVDVRSGIPALLGAVGAAALAGATALPHRRLSACLPAGLPACPPSPDHRTLSVKLCVDDA
eukprot:COSAG01_NODE_586_length_15170_cov_32.511512_12_plen_118_part_00